MAAVLVFTLEVTPRAAVSRTPELTHLFVRALGGTVRVLGANTSLLDLLSGPAEDGRLTIELVPIHFVGFPPLLFHPFDDPAAVK